MNKLLIATSNPGKRSELLSALLPLDGFEILTPEDLDLFIDVDESGDTYLENALIKAQSFFDHSGVPTLAEDSGIEVSALGNELGVFTRRWGAGEEASDDDWLEYFMNRMAQEEDRAARFVSHVAFLDEQNQVTFEGECLGEITHDIQGPVRPGVQLSAVFKPVGEELVYSAMDDEHKNSLSHRGHAVKQMKEWLVREY